MEGAIVNSRHHHAGGAGGREDCWSEGATETLIEAWGDRYLQLSRGNLRQKDWREVADAVNGRENGVKPRRTDVQCKNRIDTLKKKYKLEKAKAASSKWPFYHRLDHLIGANASIGSTKRNAESLSVPRPTTVTFTVKSRAKLSSFQNPNPNLNPLVYSGGSSSKSRLNLSGSNNSSPDGGGGGGAGRADNELFVADGGVSRKHGMDYLDLSEADLSEETAYKELASAILRFGEVYERIESSKQQQMMELEKERMEFTKDLEFQTMNMYMEAQLELEKMKRSKKYAPPGAASSKLNVRTEKKS